MGTRFYAEMAAPAAVGTGFTPMIGIKALSQASPKLEQPAKRAVLRVFFTGTTASAEKATVQIARGISGGGSTGITEVASHGANDAVAPTAVVRQITSAWSGGKTIGTFLVHPQGDRTIPLPSDIMPGDEVGVQIKAPAAVNAFVTVEWEEGD